jgi:FtsP/CotA-like multicopper oxidase with cupredoxin domain
VQGIGSLAVGPFEKEGAVFAIDDLPYNRMAGKKGVERFGTIRITWRKASTALVPARLSEIAPLVTEMADVTRSVKLGFKMSLRRGFDFVINHERHHHDKPVKVGELQVWDVVNTTMMDHPFHLHGFFFQVLEINGKKWRLPLAGVGELSGWENFSPLFFKREWRAPQGCYGFTKVTVVTELLVRFGSTAPDVADGVADDVL